MPGVSIIIPTRNRPRLLERAIRSVLAQSCQDFEIIIVIDGPDPHTEPSHLRVLDPRIEVLSLPENVGLAEARNLGILHAGRRWIALLDDDDEWLPDKLELQLAAARALGGEYAFVPCRFIEKTLTIERHMPLQLPTSPLRFSEYIYCDGGYLQPSTFFMSRALCLEIPFTSGLRHIEDSDWLLRAMRHPQIQIGSVTQTCSIYYNVKTGERESETTRWEHPLHWAIQHRELFTPRAFPFFVARLCLNARRLGEPFSVFLLLLNAARRYGSLTPRSLAFFFAYWYLGDASLKRLRALFTSLAASLSLRAPAVT